jgi:hypothetical protein
VTSPEEGRILTSTPGTWTGYPTPGTYIQWAHCDTKPVTLIPGATVKTYTISSADIWHTLCVIVTARNKAGSTTVSSPPTGLVEPGTPIDRAAPTISGLAEAGRTLTASPGSWGGSSPMSYAYQWRRCDSAGTGCFAIRGATSSTYVLSASDIGHTLSVKVTATNEAGSSSTNSRGTSVVAPGKPGSPSNVTSAAVYALLLKTLVLHGAGAELGAVLRHGGYSFSFVAPSSGRLAVSWYRPLGRGGRVRIATASFTFHKAGTALIKLVLNGKGRRLLRGAKRMKLIATGAFTPAGQATTKATTSITLRRSAVRGRTGQKNHP